MSKWKMENGKWKMEFTICHLPFSIFHSFVFLLLGLASATASAQDRLPRYQTKYYILHTDVDREFADDLHRRLDLMYEEYSRRLAAFARATDSPKFDVYIFAKRSDYDQFTDHNAPNSAGVFISARNALAAFVEGQPRDAVRKMTALFSGSGSFA